MPLSMSALPPKADIRQQATGCPLCANTGLMHCNKKSVSSIVLAVACAFVLPCNSALTQATDAGKALVANEALQLTAKYPTV